MHRIAFVSTNHGPPQGWKVTHSRCSLDLSVSIAWRMLLDLLLQGGTQSIVVLGKRFGGLRWHGELVDSWWVGAAILKVQVDRFVGSLRADFATGPSAHPRFDFLGSDLHETRRPIPLVANRANPFERFIDVILRERAGDAKAQIGVGIYESDFLDLIGLD